jgi:hypothetical protein
MKNLFGLSLILMTMTMNPNIEKFLRFIANPPSRHICGVEPAAIDFPNLASPKDIKQLNIKALKGSVARTRWR